MMFANMLGGMAMNKKGDEGCGLQYAMLFFARNYPLD
jgi:hypothetical protein